jgi:hypothetical protein
MLAQQSPPKLREGAYTCCVWLAYEPSQGSQRCQREMKGKHGRISLSTIAIIVGMIAGPLAVWGDSQKERGTTNEKLTTLERRQNEDRKDTRAAISEVKEHVKLIDHNTQIILQKITAMEAVQRSERRERQ